MDQTVRRQLRAVVIVALIIVAGLWWWTLHAKHTELSIEAISWSPSTGLTLLGAGASQLMTNKQATLVSFTPATTDVNGQALAKVLVGYQFAVGYVEPSGTSIKVGSEPAGIDDIPSTTVRGAGILDIKE